MFPSTNKLASAKRGAKERQGVHAWHPYYAGYSEAFVSSAIEYLGVNNSHVLLDPWHGSGTTALVASRYKLLIIGLEINPAMHLFANVKNGFLLKQINIIKTIHKEIENIVIKLPEMLEPEDQSILDFMSSSLAQGITTIYEAINNYNYPCVNYNQILFTPFLEMPSLTNPFEALLKSSLLVTARKLAGYRGGSNPTWVKTLVNKPQYHLKDILFDWSIVTNLMINDLSLSILKLDDINSLSVLENSRKLNIKTSSIDAIITSPPYLTRIDYAMSTKPEILIISNSCNLRKIREQTIGSPVITDKTITINALWGKTCSELLNQIKTHTSKAAISYYLPNIIQYFKSIETSLAEILRVLKPESQALIVVQSSYFKEHEINLGQIYTEIIENLGGKSKIINREIVRNHLAHLNTKSSLYKGSKIYYEDIICVTK
jgi:DNA modification methylase